MDGGSVKQILFGQRAENNIQWKTASGSRRVVTVNTIRLSKKEDRYAFKVDSEF
jgi:hypothetical protein